MNESNFKLIKGVELPRVTYILKVLSKGEFFEKWLKTQGANADYILKEAGFIGTDLHNILENIGKGIALPELTGRVKEWVDEFQAWKNLNVESFLETEKEIYTDRYCGTLDALVKLKDGKVALLDFKTSKFFYDTHFIQVAAYVFAYQQMANTTIDQAFILRFEKGDKKPVFEIKEVTDLAHQYTIFNKVLDVWYWKREMYERIKS